MFLKKFGDLAAGVFFLILSIALFLAASALPPSLMGGLGSGFMPKVLAIITCILSFFQIRAGFRTMRSFQPNEGAEEEKPEYLRVLATIAADERRHAKRLSPYMCLSLSRRASSSAPSCTCLHRSLSWRPKRSGASKGSSCSR